MGNWKIFDGDYYVSKFGSDAPGTTGLQDTPFLTIGKAIATASNFQKIVIGTGVYEEDIDVGYHIKLVADGTVIMDGSQTGIVAIYSLSSQTEIDGITFQNYGTAIEGSSVQSIRNCIFRNTSFNCTTVTLQGCIFVNTHIFSSNIQNVQKCTFINSPFQTTNVGTTYHIINCHFDENSNVRFHTSGVKRLLTFDYCNVLSDIQSMTDGILRDFDTFKSFYSPLYLQNSFQDFNPMFNTDISPEDFTYKDGSPNLFKGSDGLHIGATLRGFAFDGNAAGWDPVGLDVDPGTGNVTLGPSVNVGTLTSPVINLGKKLKLGRIKLHGLLELPLRTIDHNTTDENPNRLTYRLKHSAVSAAAAGTANWQIMEWNAIPSQDAQTPSLGNGDEAFDISTQDLIEAQWIQVEVTLRDNGTGG